MSPLLGGILLALTGAAPCWPEALEPLERFVAVQHRTMVARVAGAGLVEVDAAGMIRREHLGDEDDVALELIIYSIEGHLAAIDDHPGDPTESDLVDTGMVAPDGMVRSPRAPSCDWQRLPRAVPHEAPGPESRQRL
jgi:hypothetical protein